MMGSVVKPLTPILIMEKRLIKMKKFLFLVVILVFVLSACSSSSPTTPATIDDIQVNIVTSTPSSGIETPTQPEADQGSSEAYPGPQSPPTYVPPYPMTDETPVASSDEPFVIPSPNAEMGVVTGILINEDTGLPLAYQSVYLGEKILITPGPGYSVGVQENSSPHSMSNSQGQFAIGDIEPGSYLLMVWTPFAASIMVDPQTGLDFEVIVEAGVTLDLGQVRAADPFAR